MGAACMPGSWLVDNASFADVISSPGVQVVDAVTGIARFIAVHDGLAVTEYVDWTHEISVTDPAGTTVLVRNGADTGEWVAGEDGFFSLIDVDNASTIEGKVTFEVASITVPTIRNSPSVLSLGTFECAATSP